MLLKRLYERNEDGSLRMGHSGKPVVTGVRVLHAGQRQNFTPKFIMRSGAEGWLSTSSGKVVIQAEAGAIVYRIKHGPGFYCCHCGAPMSNGVMARDHVMALHLGEKSPDGNNPAGYRQDNFFSCVREE